MGNHTSNNNEPRVEPRAKAVWIQLQCPGNRIKIRAHPRKDSEVVGFLRHGEIVEIIPVTRNGYVQLSDERVRVSLYYFY